MMKLPVRCNISSRVPAVLLNLPNVRNEGWARLTRLRRVDGTFNVDSSHCTDTNRRLILNAINSVFRSDLKDLFPFLPSLLVVPFSVFAASWHYPDIGFFFTVTKLYNLCLFAIRRRSPTPCSLLMEVFACR